MASKALQPLLIYAVLLALSAVFISPFLWMLSTSLKHESRIFPKPGEPPQWIPTTARVDAGGRPVVVYEGREGVDLGPDEMGRHVLRIGATETPAWPGDFEVRQRIGLHWQNYADAFHKMAFWQNLRNTLFICVTVVLGTLVSCSLVAYSFARIPWPGRDTVFILVLATMMLPYQVTLIPLFAMYRELGWVGTFKPLIIPAFFGTPFYIFLLRQFFLGVPQDLSASARIDGCNEFGIYLFIMLPLSKPALATTALFMFLFQWADFLSPLVYLQDDRQYTLAIALQQFQSHHESAWGPLMAMSSVITIPIIILFFLTQRTFIQGITLTGLKG
ncbi:MAG TPA: carbohydrate ABC transporter permease [Candidatus Hydrogenedentes bacterium]|jgi:multiple sugar transport system permease protein|nr:carbohydrate ABC transporter permease [Candidatus Hydrogenedentota bacterium]MDY0030603.1 carbohydrate ABC transporter permease [FCB group bacterium]NLT59923.1 carbohydrate ABC transporter permease [Candidatus Hydrogenedentota bacterium]HNV21518.1 carbohydrate ABC transporter permease [Candidatus Hydrogenedentota bacterium]HNZ17325.1 carbohydrate ABC transporter permease [Candidatus Hydrogenedentota bacterium]